MNDAELLRYSRHILLDEIGVEGQERLLKSHALVVGAGGLGSPAAMYLASAGVGRITICDGDKVDLTNLQRQIIHRTDSVGMEKVKSAATTIAALNPLVNIQTVAHRVEGKALLDLVAACDVVLDASDNFATRHAINEACVAACRPLVSGAAIRFDGQVSVFDPRADDSPCYACLFPPSSENEDVPCSVMGVFAPLTGMVGTMQAAEALKLLANTGTTLKGRLLLVDARDMSIRTVRVKRDPGCPVCSRATGA